MSPQLSPPNKLSKKQSADDDFDTIRRYLLSCTLVDNPSENAAVLAAISGLDQELRRRERDARLQKKFSEGSSASKSKTPKSPEEPLDAGWQDVCNERKSPPRTPVAEEEEEDDDEVEIIDMEGDTSFLGKKLAEIAVASIAEFRSKAKTPLAAIALALHAAMRSPELGFACTGSVHDDDNNTKQNSSGFAKPIRDLPKTQFIDKDWDRRASSAENGEQKVVLRYRKDGLGTVLLQLTSSSNKEITVKLLPANTKEPPNQTLTFALEDHINIASWAAALRASKNMGVEPALHYKRLAFLMTAFVQNLDLGSVDDEKGVKESQAKAFIGPTRSCSAETSKRSQEFSKPIYDPYARPRGDYRAPTIDTAFPPRPMFVGDFSGDLLGGGIPGRSFGPSGNLMGPNHPLFRGGGGMTGVGDGSGFGMMPRFDPFGPPGGPQEIIDPDRVGLPSHLMPNARSGEPNPDHLRPPNTLGGNMFT